MLDFFQWIQWHFFQNRGETDFSWAGSNPYLRDNNWWGFALFLLYTQQRPVLRRLQHTHFIHHTKQGGNTGEDTAHNHSGMMRTPWVQKWSQQSYLLCWNQRGEGRTQRRPAPTQLISWVPHADRSSARFHADSEPAWPLLCICKEYGRGEAGWEPQVKEVHRGWLIPKQMTREKSVRWRELRKVFDPRGRSRKNRRAGWWGWVLWNADVWAW